MRGVTAQSEPSGTVSYLVTDSLGSVRGVVSSSGALAGTTSYDAWGNPTSTGGLTAVTPFGYAGGYTDPDGLIYLINRYYDPATGQFISVDPDVSETLQPYSYAGDNPITSNDPTGLATASKAVLYKPECGSVGCVNIAKACSASLNNCMVWWEAKFKNDWTKAKNIILFYGMQVGGHNVIKPGTYYGHPKEGTQPFDGSWGYSSKISDWGEYKYDCILEYHCTGYLHEDSEVTIEGKGTFKMPTGENFSFKLYGDWKGTGKVVPLQSKWKFPIAHPDPS